MTPDDAAVEYGSDRSWALSRSELFGTSSKRVTIKNLLEMGEFDETVAAMMYAIETTLAQVQWAHEPRDNGEKSDDPKAVEAAEFADSLLFDMETSLQDYAENAISYLLAGHSLAEVIFRQRDSSKGSRFTDNLWGVERLAEHGQLSVSQWVERNGKVVAYKQFDASGSAKEVPLGKVMHLVSRGGPGRPQGRSMFKAAYRAFLLKRRVQDSEAIGIERDLCGLPVMYMPQSDIEAATDRPNTPEGKKAKARVAAAQAAVSDMRLNDAGGLVLPSDTFEDDNGKAGSQRRYEFKIVTSAGSRTIDTRGAIRDYDLMIMRIIMMQFLRLGDRAGGSYALSDSQTTLAFRSIRAIVYKIAAEWRRKVLRTIWLLNGMDLRWLPELGSSPISEDSLQELGSFLESLASAKDLLDEDDALAADMKGRIGPKVRMKQRQQPKTQQRNAPDPGPAE